MTRDASHVGEYEPPAPDVMSASKAQEYQTWLLERLADLHADARRYRDRAAKCGWPDVAVSLNEVADAIGHVHYDLSSIGQSGSGS